MKTFVTAALLSVGAITLSANPAYAVFEGFESPDWQPGDIWKNYGGSEIQQVPSGHNGITSASGDYQCPGFGRTLCVAQQLQQHLWIGLCCEAGYLSRHNLE